MTHSQIELVFRSHILSQPGEVSIIGFRSGRVCGSSASIRPDGIRRAVFLGRKTEEARMRTCTVIIAALAVATSGCGGRTGRAYAPGFAPMVTGASASFFNGSDGKDDDTAVTVELLRRGVELSAETRSIGTHWAHDTTTAPLALSMIRAFRKSDVGDYQLRIRITPNGRDTWELTPKLTLSYSDSTFENFAWSAIRLDEKRPEVTLSLSMARIP